MKDDEELGEVSIILDIVWVISLFIAFHFKDTPRLEVILFPVAYGTFNFAVIMMGSTDEMYRQYSLYSKLKVRLVTFPFKFIWRTIKLITTISFRKGVSDLLRGLDMLEGETSKDFKKAEEVIRDENRLL